MRGVIRAVISSRRYVNFINISHSDKQVRKIFFKRLTKMRIESICTCSLICTFITIHIKIQLSILKSQN